jgi:DNA modification methylase
MLLKEGQEYRVVLEDCIEHMAKMPAKSVDFAVYSPPFPSLYAYTSMEADIGNSEDLKTEAKIHLSFFYNQFARILKPGRIAMVHVTQIPRMKRSGGQGMCDFRGMNIRLGERAGLIYEYDWLVRKNPQSQAIRTRSRELQFSGLESNRLKSRGAIPDYLIKFVAPGDSDTVVDSEGEISRNQWIDWAEPHWSDIKETETLNVAEGRSEEDTKHICPLQLEVIRRLILLYTNPGEIVFTPFAGIGSEIYMALLNGRKGYGCEIKPEYHEVAVKNAVRAIRKRDSLQALPLFDH